MNKNERVLSIDRMKGFIVFCMVFFVACSYFPCLGILSRIANQSDNPVMFTKNITIADFTIPLFVLLTTLSLEISFSRRYSREGKNAYKHFIERNLILVSLGYLMFSFERFFIRREEDPIILGTILMFEVFALFFLYFVFWIFKSEFRKKIGLVLKYSLLSLGTLGVILSVYNSIQIFVLGKTYSEIVMYWSILHQIGLTGLLTIPFLKLTTKQKAVSWVIVSISYILIQLIPGAVEKFEIIVLGGSAGCIGWLIFRLGAMVMISLFSKNETKKYFWLITLSLVVLSYLSCKYLEINVRAVTVNYVFLSLLISLVLYGFVNLFDNYRLKYDFLVMWGSNPLLIFVIGVILKAILMIWDPSPETPLAFALAFIFSGFCLIQSIAWYCYKKEIIIKL